MAAAVLAQAASFDNLCRVSGLDERQALAALEELLKRQLLIEPPALQRWAHDPVYTFSHQKVSEVVYAEAGTARRRMLHRRAFAVLQAMAVPSSELAHHALAAGLLAETIQHSLMAGNDAMALFAVHVAIAHFETARQVAEQNGWPETISGADRQALYVGLGRAHELTEKWSQAQEVYQAMIAIAQSMGAAAMECLGLTHLATVHIMGLRSPEDHQKALVLLERARSLAEQNDDRRGLAETEWTLALAANAINARNLSLSHTERALAIARELEHPQLLARCLDSLSVANIVLRCWDKAEAYAAEACRLYATAGNKIMFADSQRHVGLGQWFGGRPQAAVATLRESLAFSQQIENRWGQADCASKMMIPLAEIGRYGEAIKVGRQGVEQTRQIGEPFMALMARLAFGTVQRTIMARDAAEKTLTEVLADFIEQGLNAFPDWAPAELCALYASFGEWEQAGSYARKVLQARRDETLLPMGFTGWYETEALLRGGDGDLARAEVERLAGIVGNNRRYRLILLRSQAVLAQWDGDLGQATTHLQAALALAQEMGLPGEAWLIVGELGRLYGEQGERVQAREAYREAAKIVHHLAETIDEEALRGGFLAAAPVRTILEIGEI